MAVIRPFKGIFYNQEKIDLTWDRAQRAPHRLASLTGEYVLQIIDEFQYLNSRIYRDQACTNLMGDLANSYLTIAESKVAPVLCAGSYVSWLTRILIHHLPGRFRIIKLKELEIEEAIECVYRYSNYYKVEVTPETASYISELCERHPFYIGTLIRSAYPSKELTTLKGVEQVFEYELSEDGEIRGICNEYIEGTFTKVNEKNAKKMVLFLVKNNDREYTVMEIKERLGLDLEQDEIINKLRVLSETDLVLKGSSSIDFRGIRDNIIARIIRMYYEREIEGITKEELKRRLQEENKRKQEEAEKILKRKEMISRYHRGRFAEYCILYYLEREGEKLRDNLKERVYGLDKDVIIEGYRTMLRYQVTLEGKSFEIDLYAKSKKEAKPILVWESKNYKDKKVTEGEVKEFEEKVELIKKYEYPKEVIGIFYSSSGFSDSAIMYMKSKGLIYTDYNTLWKGFV